MVPGSFLGLPYRVLNIDHRKELLRGLWATLSDQSVVPSLAHRRHTKSKT